MSDAVSLSSQCDGAQLGFGQCRFAYNQGVRLHFHVRGEGPMVVLLHGFPEFWGVWCDVADQLSDNFTLVMPDMRGCNLSAAPSELSLFTSPYLASDVMTVARSVGSNPFVCVAHDLAGLAAWAMPALYPDALAGLVLVSAPHPQDLATQHATAQEKTYLHRILEGDGGPLRKSAQRLFWCEEPLMRARLRRAMARSPADALFSPYRANLRQPLPAFWAQTYEGHAMCIWGEEDPFVSPTLMQAATARMTNAQVRSLSHFGHFLPHLGSAMLAKTITDFVLSYRT